MPQILVYSGDVNQFLIGEDSFYRYGTTVNYNSGTGTITVKQGDTTLIDNVLFSAISGDDVDFTSFDEMKSWIDNNVVFNGYLLDQTSGFIDCFLINGKPYKKGAMYLAWDDVNQTLEVRHSHYDFADKPIPATSYSNIVVLDEYSGFSSYNDLIQWFITNAFLNLTPA